MKKRVIAVIFALLFSLSLAAVQVLADEADTAPAPYVIDDMSSHKSWLSTDFSVSRAVYTEDTLHLSSSETDKGYLIFSASAVESGKDLTVKRTFDEPVNLYKHSNISFDWFLSADFPVDKDASVTFTLTVTLHSGTSSVSESVSASVGEWTKADIQLTNWNRRSSVDAISITLTPLYESTDYLRLSLRMDSLTAHGAADTSFEDRYMTPAFTVKDGSLTSYADGTVSWRRLSFSSLSASISYSDPAEALGHNTLRAVISVNTDTELRLTAVYADGTVYESKSQTVAESAAHTAVYFSFPSPEKALRFALVSDTEGGGNVDIYSIDTVFLPTEQTKSDIGTLDVCAFDPEGVLNLRGTVSSDAVIEHIDGTIRIYAVPTYRTVEDAVLSSDPIAETTMSTRYNISIDPSAIPDGGTATRYAVIIADGTSLISVCEPSLPDTAKAGVLRPSTSGSLKGITSADISHEAGLTEITVDYGELFGSPTSSKIYSEFGELFYFSSELLSRLDLSVKTLSLSGTDVYLRLTDRDENGTPRLITADSAESFKKLYAAVDFLSSRYSSPEYGYISGMIIGESVTDASDMTEADCIKSLVNAASVIKCAGSAHVSDFKVLFPLGKELTADKPSLASTELALRMITFYSVTADLSDYGLVWQADTVASVADAAAVMKHASSVGGNAPRQCIVKYTPTDIGYPSVDGLLDKTVRAYISAVSQNSVHGFILDSDSAPDIVIDDRFNAFFAKLDTNIYPDTFKELYGSEDTIPMPSPAAEKRTFSRLLSEAEIKTAVNTLGTTLIFDYSDAFYTGGWFTLTKNGECMTVKAGSGRAMRASGSIMYSWQTPLDLSAAPVLGFELYGDETAVYSLTVISPGASVTSDFIVTPNSCGVYIDLSDFAGVSKVTGVIIAPKIAENTSVYIKNVSCGSFTLTDAELADRFSSGTGSSDTETAKPEENIVEIIAVVSAAAVVSALAFALLRRKKED